MLSTRPPGTDAGARAISAVVVVRAVVWRGFYNNNNMYPVTCANLQTTTTTQHNGGPHHAKVLVSLALASRVARDSLNVRAT